MKKYVELKAKTFPEAIKHDKKYIQESQRNTSSKNNILKSQTQYTNC